MQRTLAAAVLTAFALVGIAGPAMAKPDPICVWIADLDGHARETCVYF